jgi:hypothetical protein
MVALTVQPTPASWPYVKCTWHPPIIMSFSSPVGRGLCVIRSLLLRRLFLIAAFGAFGAFGWFSGLRRRRGLRINGHLWIDDRRIDD